MPKNWGLGQFVNLRGRTWQERGRVVFLRVVDTPIHTMIEKSKKRLIPRFLWHRILTSSYFSTNVGKVMPWAETTISITWNDALVAMIDSVNYHP